jgi:major membrane immunogen (membrane-anchored lipoprotein)
MKGVLLLVAALVCSVLLTSCGKAGSSTGTKATAGSTSAQTSATDTTTTSGVAAVPLSEQLVTGQVVKLKPRGFERPEGGSSRRSY